MVRDVRITRGQCSGFNGMQLVWEGVLILLILVWSVVVCESGLGTTLTMTFFFRPPRAGAVITSHLVS